MCDIRVEIAERDRIWAMDESLIDRELSVRRLDPSQLVGRVEAMLGLEPTSCDDEHERPAAAACAVVAAPAMPAVSKSPAASGMSSASAAATSALADKPAPAPFEITGKVKYFDPIKRYGFIVPDDDQGGDVLLHVTCLHAAGYRTAYEGARIHAIAQKGPKGLLALEVLSMDESTAIHPSERPQRTHVVVRPESEWQRVEVKWYNCALGYGFLTRGEDTEDIFVHAETLRRWGFAALRQGQFLEARWGMGSKGCMVAELRLVGDPARWQTH
jgi:CspA family cold shock protein